MWSAGPDLTNLTSVNLDKNLTEVKGIPQKLKSVMGKKDKILKILNGISYNEKMLKEKLTDLMKRASALDITRDSKNAIKDIKKLEENLNEVTKKKGFFEKEAKKIFEMLRFK